MGKPGESKVKEYLESKGLTVFKIPEQGMKTVDFAVYLDREVVFYLEEKTLELTPLAWKQVDPVYNTIAKHVYEATRQFKSVNPARNVPNILSFTNMNPARSVDDLFITLTGQVITPGGKMRSIPGMQRIKNDLQVIDLYLWFDSDQLTGHIWEESNPLYQEQLTEILGLE